MNTNVFVKICALYRQIRFKNYLESKPNRSYKRLYITDHRFKCRINAPLNLYRHNTRSYKVGFYNEVSHEKFIDCFNGKFSSGLSK
jgi:hypothetical protein